ncbi:MAG: ferredoxin--NADP reductase [Halobacteriales archaeon]
MEGEPVEVYEVRDVEGDDFVVTTESPYGDVSPGQFVQVGLDVDGVRVVRHYTLSNSHPEDELEFTVELDPEGELSPRLRELDAGDTVYVAGPFGRSYYEDEDAVTVVVGGPGVGPAVGIAERALERDADVAVVYEDETHAHVDRLRDVEKRGGHVSLVDASGLESAVAEALGEVDGQAFVYGFSGFVDRALAALGDVDAKVERFD